MRVIFIFFIVINIAFFVWQADLTGGQRSQGTKALTAIPGNVAQLVLLDEIGTSTLDSDNKTDTPKTGTRESLPQTTEAVIASLPVQKHTAKDYACYALGPFRDVALSTPVILKLRDLGAITNPRREEEKVTTGYWVYLPPVESWKEAREQVMALENKGMKDIFIMGRGSMKNAISVGLFTSEKAANNRVARLKKLGVEPKVQQQYSSTPKYWIDIDIDADQDETISAIEAIARGLSQQDLKSRKCGK